MTSLVGKGWGEIPAPNRLSNHKPNTNMNIKINTLPQHLHESIEIENKADEWQNYQGGSTAHIEITGLEVFVHADKIESLKTAVIESICSPQDGCEKIAVTVEDGQLNPCNLDSFLCHLSRIPTSRIITELIELLDDKPKTFEEWWSTIKRPWFDGPVMKDLCQSAWEAGKKSQS